MKTNELRIGNYVNVPREDQSPFKIDFFEFLHETGCKVAKRSFIGKTEVHPLTWYFSDLTPIPLTEEWLLKFGFTKNKDTYYLNDLGLSWLTTEDNFQTEYKLADSKWKLLDLKFVHQLQNLYFALCGEELELK